MTISLKQTLTQAYWVTIARYCTFKVTVVEWPSVPAFAVTLTTLDPAGVDWDTGPLGLLPPLGPLPPPPPQAVIEVNSIRAATGTRRLALPVWRRCPAKKIRPPSIGNDIA